eukprot:XP_023973660.1 dynein regulatory complex subunit 2-like [Physeter catodon]
MARKEKSDVISSWLPAVREVKLREMKKDVDAFIEEREHWFERQDATLEMKDLDLDDAEAFQRVVVQARNVNIKKLIELQEARIQALEKNFKDNLASAEQHFEDEMSDLTQAHTCFKQEVELIIQQIEEEEKLKAHEETTEHNTQYELIRNRNIEADHQMKSALEEQISRLKERCDTALQNYRESTDANTQEYKRLVEQDATLSKQVDLKIKQVGRLQAAIAHWRAKLAQNRQEGETRNAQMKGEVEQLRRHCKELKAKMGRSRETSKKTLTDLCASARECKRKLKEHLEVANRILRTAELCRKYETEREKVAPLPKDQSYIEDEVDWRRISEEMREEIMDVLGDDGVDEWNYLDNFFKRYNKVLLDKMAFQKLKKKTEHEIASVRSSLDSFVERVSVNVDTLNRPNTLLLVNSSRAFEAAT